MGKKNVKVNVKIEEVNDAIYSYPSHEISFPWPRSFVCRQSGRLVEKSTLYDDIPLISVFWANEHNQKPTLSWAIALKLRFLTDDASVSSQSILYIQEWSSLQEWTWIKKKNGELHRTWKILNIEYENYSLWRKLIYIHFLNKHKIFDCLFFLNFDDLFLLFMVNNKILWSQ